MYDFGCIVGVEITEDDCHIQRFHPFTRVSFPALTTMPLSLSIYTLKKNMLSSFVDWFMLNRGLLRMEILAVV
jgi:hypothetical protein